MSRYTPAVEAGLDRMREMVRGNFDLRWMEANPAGWGHRATPGPAGLRLADVETGHYAQVPEHGSAHGSMAPRGSAVPPETRAVGMYTLNEMSEVWAENAGLLYDEAVVRQWNSVTDVPWEVLQPWLRVGANLASGDTDPNDDVHGTFFQLLPTARTYAQFPFLDMMNDTDLFGQLLLKPHPMLGVRTDFHWLRLTSSRDFLYAGGGATSQHAFGYSGTPSNGRNDVAFLSDVGLTLTPCTWFTASAYSGHAFGQEVIRQAFVSPGADYGYVEMTFSF